MAEKGHKPPHLDVEIDVKDYKDGLLDVLAVIRPKWTKEAIKIKLLNQGMLNIMVVCYVTEDVDSTAVVARMFGTVLAAMTGSGVRAHEMACSKCFAELGLGPQVYCTFRNGICLEFVPGTAYTWADISAFRDIKMANRVAEELAKYHCDSSLKLAKEYKLGKGTDPGGASKMVLEAWPIKLKDPKLNEEFYKDMYTKEEFKKGLALIEEVTKQEASYGIQDALIHGDPNPTNIIYQEENDRLVMVDFEMAGVQSPLRDVTSYIFLSSMAVMEGDVENKQHTPEYTRTFLRTYLTALKKLNNDQCPVTDGPVEKYYMLVQRKMLGYLLSGPLFVPQFCNSSDRIDPRLFISTMLQRLKWYRENEERILSMKIPNV